MELRILAVGDVVGLPGLSYLSRHLRSLKQLYKIDFCVVNGEARRAVPHPRLRRAAPRGRRVRRRIGRA